MLFLEKILEQALLYDFYGELLTDRQKEIYEDFVLNDLSLGEIAIERDISRQGVYDIVKRCNRQLSAYEEKLHLVEKFLVVKKKVEDIQESVHKVLDDSQDIENILTCVHDIRRISTEILEEM